MESMDKGSHLPEHMPFKFRPHQVEGRLTLEELDEYNRLTNELYGPESFDVPDDDPRHERWLELAKQADVKS